MWGNVARLSRYGGVLVTDPADDLIRDAPWDFIINNPPTVAKADQLPPPIIFRNHEQENL